MFKISFNKVDYDRIIFATHKVDSQVELQVNDMQFRAATDFLMMLRRNIMGQKHMGGYSPLNTRYRAWKQEHGRSGLEFWSLMGDLIKSLQVYREGRQFKRVSRFFAGVPRGAMDSGGKSWFGFGPGKGGKGKRKSIEWYGSLMEHGRRGQPARPLFDPTSDEYADGGWIERGTESLNKIKWSWS